MLIIKKPFFLSLLSGVLLSLCWPTYGVTILVFIALLPLLQMEAIFSYKKNRFAFVAYSFLTFLIWNLSTTWWLINASIVGMLFANLCNSLFYTLVFVLFHWVKKRLPLRSAYIFLVSLWLAFEKLHLFWDLSWPWLHLGHAFADKIYWIQWYEYTGVAGGSLWVLLINIGLFEVLKKYLSHPRIVLIKNTIPWLLMLALPIVFSFHLYNQVPSGTEKINMVLVQPNVDPYTEKYGQTNADFFKAFEEQIREHISGATDYIILPETYFSDGNGIQLKTYAQSDLHFAFQSFLGDYQNTEIISGIQFYDLYRSQKAPTLTANKIRNGIWADFYNSAVREHYQSPIEVYHKSKLVVGVENLPFKSILNPLIGSVLLDMGGTVASRVTQSKRTVFEHNSKAVVAAPIICYESVYGAFVSDYVKQGATFLAIISNDAWWDNTEGHRQLLRYTQLRAIETRRAIARSANTGISALINARGELVNSLPYGQKGVLNASLFSRNNLTFYTQYDDMLYRWAAFVFILLFLLAISGRLKANKD
ncbi:MAG: apolipoprotein N-acyltransferase [Flavobacteriaceae bacterium]